MGVTVAAFGTSSPELLVAIHAALDGVPQISLGDVLGSNIFNAFFIAAVAALIQPCAVKVPEVLPSLVFGVITTLLILPGKGGSLGRWRGFALLAIYAVFVPLTVNQASQAHP